MYVHEATENQLSYDDAEYIAGVIDGDGSISCDIKRGYKGKISNLRKEIVLTNSTNYVSITNLKERLKIYNTYISKDTKKGNNRNAWKLRLSTKEIPRFLEIIKSHLVNKDRHAVLLLRICKGIDVDKSFRELSLVNQRGKQNNILSDDFIKLYKSKLPTEIAQPSILQPFTGKVCKRAAYMAGSVDTDGSITMQQDIRPKNVYYDLIILLNVSSKEYYTEELKKMFYSNNIFTDYTHYSSTFNPNSNDSYIIHIRSKYHMQFLREVIPFMDTRLPQAETAMKYLKKEIDGLTCYEILKDLNKRGKEAYDEVNEEKPKINVNINPKKVNTLTVDTRKITPYNTKKPKIPTQTLDEFGIIR